jgi:hypothetical protein
MAELNETTVSTGLYGYAALGVGAFGDGFTGVDLAQPILTPGTLSRVHMRLSADEDADAGVVKIGILRPLGSDQYTVIDSVDITDSVNDAQGSTVGAFEYDTADYPEVDLTGITVIAGDCLAFYSDDVITAGNATHTGFNVKFESGDQLTSGTVTIDDVDLADKSLYADVYVTTEESIIFDDDTGYGDGDVILIPTISSEIYTIVIKDVTVPNGETLKIDTILRGLIEDNNVFFDMSQAAGSDVIAVRDKDDAVIDNIFTVPVSNTVTFQTDDVYDLFIIVDPTADVSMSMKVSYVNYQNGQGPNDESEDSKDIANRSLSSGVWFARSLIEPIKNLTLSASAATIGRIVVARQNCVAVGDSFVAKKNQVTDPVQLSGVAEQLNIPGTWSQDRFVINGGINGNSNTFDTPGVMTSIAHRFDGVDLQLWDIPASVYIFVNGPGINDIASISSAPTTSEEAIALGEALGWSIANMASKVLNNGSQVVLNECCYIEAGYVTEGDIDLMNEAITVLNSTLAVVSFQLQVPIAKTAATVLANPDWYNADHLHLETAGYEFMADAIVLACENNTISSNPGGGGSFFVQGGFFN